MSWKKRLQKVQSSYQKLLQENFKLLDENQIRRIAGLLNVSRRVFVYGMGSSGNVAEEFQLRFMRIGLDVTAVTDSQMIQMSAALVEERMLVIAISLSGTTREIVESIRIAKSRNAKVIFITANPAPETAARCDEVLRVAYLKNLDTGTKISPQFSILVMIDILYSYYFANDSYFKAQKYKETLSAIQGKHKGAMEDAEKGEDPERFSRQFFCIYRFVLSLCLAFGKRFPAVFPLFRQKKAKCPLTIICYTY